MLGAKDSTLEVIKSALKIQCRSRQKLKTSYLILDLLSKNIA